MFQFSFPSKVILQNVEGDLFTLPEGFLWKADIATDLSISVDGHIEKAYIVQKGKAIPFQSIRHLHIIEGPAQLFVKLTSDTKGKNVTFTYKSNYLEAAFRKRYKMS